MVTDPTPSAEPRTAAGRSLWNYPLIAHMDRNALGWHIQDIEAQAAVLAATPPPVPAAPRLDAAEALALTMEEDGWEFDGDPVFGARSILKGLAARGYHLARLRSEGSE